MSKLVKPPNCPVCNEEMRPTCLGCGERWDCNCGMIIPCSCTDFQV